MKIIRNLNFTPICLIECDCCGDSHTLSLTKFTSDKSIAFSTNEKDFSFWTHFQFWLKIKLNKRAYLKNGKDRDFFQLILTPHMAAELLELLKDEGYSPHKNDSPILPFNQDVDIIYENRCVLLTKDKRDDNLLFSIYPDDISFDVWDYANGHAYADLTKQEVEEMMFSIINNYLEKKDDC